MISSINNFPVLPNSLLVTTDVKSSYTSIPNNEEIASVKKTYDHYTQKTTIPTKIITTYANVFMSEFEEKYIYPLIKSKSII